MKKAPMKINVNRIEGDMASLTITFQWDAKATPPAKQKQLWAGIGMALAAVMTKAEGRELLAKLDAARKPKPPK